MSLTSLTPLAALPIREQPSSTPPDTAVPQELAFAIGLLLGILVLAAVLLLGRRRGDSDLAVRERDIWAAMDRLCSQGWTAEVTLYGGRTPAPDDAPEVEGVRVRLDWAELNEGEHGGREIAVTRRLWSRSLAGALRAMVDDRRLDFQLEEIERANAGGEQPSERE